MKKIIIGFLLVLGFYTVALAASVSMTGIAFPNSKSPTYWHIGHTGGGNFIADANIPFEPEKMIPFNGKMVRITGELLPDRTWPTFDKGYTVEEVIALP